MVISSHVGQRLAGALAGKDERVVVSPCRPQLGEDRQRRGGKGDSVRLARLHPARRDGPDGRRLVEFVPSRPEDFAGSGGGEDQEGERLGRRARGVLQARHEGGDFAIGQGGVVAA
jgi:hypothetical protein